MSIVSKKPDSKSDIAATTQSVLKHTALLCAGTAVAYVVIPPVAGQVAASVVANNLLPVWLLPSSVQYTLGALKVIPGAEFLAIEHMRFAATKYTSSKAPFLVVPAAKAIEKTIVKTGNYLRSAISSSINFLRKPQDLSTQLSITPQVLPALPSRIPHSLTFKPTDRERVLHEHFEKIKTGNREDQGTFDKHFGLTLTQ